MWLYNLCGFSPAVFDEVFVLKFIPPPVAVLSSKADAFNNIVEISGKNKP